MARVLVVPVEAIVCCGLLLINALDLYFFSSCKDVHEAEKAFYSGWGLMVCLICQLESVSFTGFKISKTSLKEASFSHPGALEDSEISATGVDLRRSLENLPLAVQSA